MHLISSTRRARARDALSIEPIRIPPTPALRRWSAEHGFAPELVARWGEFYADLPALLDAMGRAPATYLRFNGLRGDPADSLGRLQERGLRLREGPLPQSAEVVEAPFSPGATPEYLAGRYFLQDVSSQLAPLALEPRPGQCIADLCAAPGGKTIAIADQTRDEAVIAAFDADPERHRALGSNLARCGVTSCSSWARPGQDAQRLGVQFDAILIDAPCSGEGVVSRDPRRRLGQLQEFATCAREQSALLDAAVDVLRPGGVLVYATCTLAPEENELQIARILERGDLRIEELPATLRDARLQGRALTPGLIRVGNQDLPHELSKTAHALPHLHGCLGFYVARLRKEG